MILRTLLLCLLASPATADALVATRTIPARAVLTDGDVVLVERAMPGALGRLEDALGRETRVTLYEGRAVRATDLQSPTVIERNDPVVLRFKSGGLSIQTEGRALGRAGLGDVLRVMNMASRVVVLGRVAADKSVEVGQ